MNGKAIVQELLAFADAFADMVSKRVVNNLKPHIKTTPAPPPAGHDIIPRTMLDKFEVERRTSLDITTIYRQMKAGKFPRNVKVGKRRVAWRASDIAEWEARAITHRDVAQPGSASALGAEGRGFKSRRPDHTGPGPHRDFDLKGFRKDPFDHNGECIYCDEQGEHQKNCPWLVAHPTKKLTP